MNVFELSLEPIGSSKFQEIKTFSVFLFKRKNIQLKSLFIKISIHDSSSN